MLLYKLNEIDESTLVKLCEDSTPESLTLEFKREIFDPDAKDKSKSEFLKDVTALANASGGDLIYGIEEKSGSASKINPLTDSVDGLKRRLSQILDGGVEPRINGILFHDINVDGGFVLLLRIPQSYDGPHQVSLNNEDKFHIRTGTHITRMTYEQIKSAFDRTATLAEKARSFRCERIARIEAGNTPIPILKGPICVVHIIPLASQTGRQLIDVVTLSKRSSEILLTEFGENSHSFNLDGVVSHRGLGYGVTHSLSYNQTYRVGCSEIVFTAKHEYDKEESVVYSANLGYVRDAFIRSLHLLKSIEVYGPAIFGLAMHDVDGCKLELGRSRIYQMNTKSDRNTLTLPDIWVESLEALTNVDEVIRPMMDILWQSFGLPECTLYDDQGKWNPQRR